MAWNNIPPDIGVDIQAYAWIVQFWKAVQERAWAAGAVQWPRTSHNWMNGTVAGLTNNHDGTYTLAATEDISLAYAANRWFNHTPVQSYEPQFYDLVIDNPFDETKCVHTQVLGNTAKTNSSTSTSFTISDAFAEMLVTNFITSSDISAMVGKNFYVIQRGGEWWNERWLVWPNDQESSVGLNLVAGAIQTISSLTSSGTTATAVVKTDGGHGFLSGDTVTIAGAISANSHYNGMFTVTVTTSTTFTYTIAGADTSPATGAPTAQEPHTGASDAAATFPIGKGDVGVAGTNYSTGYELMVYGNDGLLKRIALTGNEATNLYFARQTYTVSGQYAVTVAGNKYRQYKKLESVVTGLSMVCNPYAGMPFLWYHGQFLDAGGGTNNYYTRLPTDAIGSTHFPIQAITINIPFGTTSQPIFDQEFWTEFDDLHNTPDRDHTTDIYRTLHGLQVALENLCTFYVAPVSYQGEANIDPFTVATWFNFAGFGSVTVGTHSLDSVGGSGGIDIDPVTAPYFPIDVWYTLIDNTGKVITDGTNPLRHGSLDRSDHLNKDNGSFVAGDENQTAVISFGWSRQYPNEFLYMYPVRYWIPDFDGTVYVDPPTSAHPGSYTTRLPSVNYKEVDSTGLVIESNGYRPFATATTDCFARYSGDNANDPTIHPEVSTTDTSASAGLRVYANNAFEGKLGPDNIAILESSKSGTATDGGTFYLQDTSKNWWFNGVFSVTTDSFSATCTTFGTFDSGSATSGGDSSKSSNGFWGLLRWQNQSVEILISGTWYRRRIATYVSGTSIFWNEPLPSSASGCTYRIREPRPTGATTLPCPQGRWGSRSLQVSLPDGSQHTISIISSDDNTLYFDPQPFTIPVGASYSIIEHTPGGVWQWDGAKWIVPTGNDPRTGVAWHTDQTENLPNFNESVGRILKGDYFSPLLFSQLFSAIQALVWTFKSLAWTAKGDTNHFTGGVDGRAISAYGTAQSDAATPPTWAGSTSDAPPYAVAYSDNKCSCCSYHLGRRYAYGRVDNISAKQNSTVDYYAFAVNANDTLSGGSTDNFHTNCPHINIFDPQSDAVTSEAWSLFDSEGPSMVTPRFSLALGSSAVPDAVVLAPADCSDPSNPIECDEFQGYSVTDQKALIRWNVSGGFVFQ